MTVCIAAISSLVIEREGKPTYWKAIVGAADHMLTAEASAIEFESPEPKIHPLSRFCVAMISGDSSVQSVLVSRTIQSLLAKHSDLAETTKVIPIEEIANLYADLFAQYRRELSVRRWLTPLGLDSQSFIEKQRDLNPTIAATLTDALQGMELEAETIIAGLDSTGTGAHIYVVRDPGIAVCADREGFAAAGIGAQHAESQFMFRRYSQHTPVGEALVLVYSAKKHAETAPGVGTATDVLFVGPWLGWGLASPAEKAELDNIYKDTRAAIDTADERAAKRGQAYVETIIQAGKKPAEISTGQSQSPGKSSPVPGGSPESKARG